MTYKVDLQVVTSGGQELPDGLKEYADKHDISYEVSQSGDDRSIVTFEANSRDQLEDMITQAYAPDNESERSQFFEQIRGEDSDTDKAPGADGESYLTYGTPEPRSDLDIHKPAPGQPDTQLEEAKARQAGGEVDHSDSEQDDEDQQDDEDNKKQ